MEKNRLKTKGKAGGTGRFFLYVAVLVLVILLDRWSKAVILRTFTPGGTRSIPVIRRFFSISYVENDGVAFGMFGGSQLVTMLVPLFLAAGCLVVMWLLRGRLSSLAMWGLALVAGGGIGNIIDRLCYGYVVDFLDFYVWNPVFNVADIAVCTGCGLVMLYALIGKDINER